tara:strand:- start:3722 stop:3994 length:273 start_codon:yes stop_codon:yes gene_type:complete
MKGETIFFIGISIFLTLIILKEVKTGHEKKNVITKAGTVIRQMVDDGRVLENKYLDQCVINIILRNKVSGRAERELQADTTYMNLVTKGQ